MHFNSDLRTPFGTVRVAYTGDGHVAVLTIHDECEPFKVQHKSPLSLNLHLYRNESGQFVPQDSSDMILSKIDYARFNDRDASPTARQKVLEVIPPLVTKFLDEHTAEVAAEDVEEILRQMKRVSREIEEMEGKLAPLKEQHLELVAQHLELVARFWEAKRKL